MRINLQSTTPQYVGDLTQEIIACLGLQEKPGPIYIGPSNIRHIRDKHPVEFAMYLQNIPRIIQVPDCIGVHPKQGGVEFIKMFDQHIMVSVRLSSRGVLFVRSLYAVTNERIQTYLQKGTIVPFTKEEKGNH